MKKAKIYASILIILFTLITTMAISTLTLNAIKDPGTKDSEGKWETVCCGAICPGNEDICHGDGTFKCCK